MNIHDQIKILKAFRDGEELNVTNTLLAKESSLRILYDPNYKFNFHHLVYEIVKRELKRTWQPMETVPQGVNIDLLTKGGAIHNNVKTIILNTNDYVAWMDSPLPPEWIAND